MGAGTPVLAIGLAGYKGMTAQQMAAGSEQMAAECTKVGIQFESCFVHAEFPETEREELVKVLRSRSWAVVQIGSGLRLDVQHTRLLEDVVGMVWREVKGPLGPPKLAFPTRPDEMIGTFLRMIEEGKGKPEAGGG